MFAVLKQLKDNDRVADFLIPGFPEIVKGRVTRLDAEVAVVTVTQNGVVYEVIAHPANVGVIQRV